MQANIFLMMFSKIDLFDKINPMIVSFIGLILFSSCSEVKDQCYYEHSYKIHIMYHDPRGDHSYNVHFHTYINDKHGYSFVKEHSKLHVMRGLDYVFSFDKVDKFKLIQHEIKQEGCPPVRTEIDSDTLK